ncbi:MAG: PhoH family protein [Clostridium sp.]|uniref:PhoH family protein n=1 Tax=Clostridium sp. TaxID=1506 RepID=UPI0025C5DD54|nr:PhoH family protein [Clostridium sp.]MCE5220096.1 PhoH family protein [Clostridium sp.]
MKHFFIDTNVLMSHSIELFSEDNTIYICDVVLSELDKHKTSSDPNKQFQARQAHRLIKQNKDKIKYCIKNGDFKLPDSFGLDSNDNRIISIYGDLYNQDSNLICLSNDLNFQYKCECLGLPIEEFGQDENFEKYTGIRELSLTKEECTNLIENPDFYNLHPNEYVIINNITSNEQKLFVWNNRYLEEVKIKPITNKYVNKITPLDIYQKAFIHMLQNDDVKIKITDSTWGAGKSFLMIHWALQMLDKEKVNKLYFVKSDSPPKGRKEFPAIPGDVVDKCEPLLGVLCDTTSEDNLTDILLRNNKLEILPIQFAKGRSLRKSILYINECQDFIPSEMERLLSRIGEDTIALLDGSTAQIDNKYCLNRNGLTVASDNFKDKINSAQVNMIEDYRSEISKMVSQMDWFD